MQSSYFMFVLFCVNDDGYGYLLFEILSWPDDKSSNKTSAPMKQKQIQQPTAPTNNKKLM